MSGVEIAPYVGSTVTVTFRFRDPTTRALEDVEEPVFGRFRHEDDDVPSSLSVTRVATGTFEGQLTGARVGWYFCDATSSSIETVVAVGQIQFRENPVDAVA